MLCWCGIVIQLPQWFRRKRSGTRNNGTGELTVRPPTYISVIEAVASHVDEISPQEVTTDGPNFLRSQAPSPESLGQISDQREEYLKSVEI
ncbi:uncharacterized protein PV06_11052 [Exophiala oligosperma]|uniref:Uncharacterized protein n=1 Tax=Exophiala oligosperma TaxID=215243 RepID=A0A0D2BGZ1_9EURO|nr:uncharacterized protein PV06_11052 [Exophiala oligosperma]KIW36757.1 hypothetical protein PV06_11052 [Exophiala oligosperma]